MSHVGEPFIATHTAPAVGMATWSYPGSATPGPRLDPYLSVRLVRVYGDWAQVVCSNGWSAWVDGRSLAPVGGHLLAGTVLAAADAPATAVSLRRFKFHAPTKTTWPLSAGAALVVLAVFLPWIDFGSGATVVNAVKVPAAFLFSKDKLVGGGPGLGVVLLLFAVGAFVLGHVDGWEKRAKVPGALCVPVVVLFVVQMNAVLGAVKRAGGAKVPSLLDVVGIGVWSALVGGALLAWGGKRT